jgi:hypothetical protein
MRFLALAALLLATSAAVASVARAGGVNFNWGTVCYTEAPASVRTFACNTNSGTHPMTMSFRLDADMTDMVGLEIEVEGQSDATSLPDWWKLGAADCRPNGLAYSGDNSAVATETCADWNGGAGFVVPASYTWDADRAHVTCGYAIDASAPFSLPANVEHYAGTLTLRDTKTVGAGACAGCESGFTWWISRITVAGISGRRDELTTALPGGNQFLYWNRAARTPSALALLSSPNPSAYLQDVALTATVTPSSATGLVEFAEGDSTLGSATVTGGTATLSVPGLTEGDHAIVARYGGDGEAERAFAPAWTHTVTPRPTSTVTLTSSPNPSAQGHSVRLTAAIAPSGATGNVSFRDGDALIATVPVQADTAGYLRVTGFSTMGAHYLTASYAGDATHAPATSPALTHVVAERESTSVTFTFTPSSTFVYNSVLFTAQVSPPAATGSVAFSAVGLMNESGGGTVSSGQASGRIWFRCGGTYSVRATYSGDTRYLPSQSAVDSIVVAPQAGSLTLVVSPSNICLGEPLSLTAFVAEREGHATCASSTVQFMVDGSPLGGPVATTYFGASLTGITNLPIGTHTIQAIFSGDASFLPCTSSVHTCVVSSPSPTTATITTSPNPSCLGQAVTLTALVKGAAYCPAPGVVQFEVDGAPLGDPVALSNGAAVLGGLTSFALGPHSVRALYPGSGDFPPCSSAPLTHMTGLAPLTRSVRDVPNDQGGHVTVTWAPGCSEDSVEVYRILRRSATGEWEQLGSQAPLGLSTYSYVATTLGDSIAGFVPYTVFMIEAHWTGGQSWYSPADSGYSVDNLVPAAPYPFYAILSHPTNHLVWWAPADADVALYRLYRGPALDDFVPGPDNLIAELVGTDYEDPQTGMAVYRVCAVDSHGKQGYSAMAVTTLGAADVPGEGVAFALERAGPNPSHGDRLSVAFTLAEPAPARLRLLDVSGRRLAEMEVGALGTGRHVVELGRGLTPGLYLVRLTQGAQVRVLRVAVVE